MSTINNNKKLYNIEVSENIDPRYKDIPMDLNSSPLQDYFEQFGLLNNTIETAAPQSEIASNAKTMPVLIPGSSEKNTHKRKNRHHKRRRKLVAHTFPDEGLEVVKERRLQQKVISGTQSNNKGKSSQNFIVGSLQEKAPVPWPSTLTTAADINRHRLKNRQTVNWPLVPEHSRRYRKFIEEEDSIFNMDSDYYNSSDFDEEEEDEFDQFLSQ